MAILKSELRNLARLFIDDPQAKLWLDADLDLLTEQTMDALWARIHEFFPFFTSQVDTITNLSPGYADLGLTGVGSGQLSKRIHRLQSCVVGSASANALTYQWTDPRDVVLQGGKVIYASNYRYVFYGPQLWQFPLDVSTSNVDIRYSYKPTPAYRTLGDSVTIGWPDGHEAALWWEVAARAISRGAREDPSTFRQWAQDAWMEMIASIKNPQIGPMVAWSSDSPTSFGGT